MNTAKSRRIPRWVSIPLSILVFAVCAFYTYASAYLAPYPGFEWKGTSNEVGTIEPCQAPRALCEANQGVLQAGDEILAVDGVDFDEVSKNLYEIPFGEYHSGDPVSITFLRDGQERTADWLIVGPTAAGQAYRLFILLLFWVPFWLNGSLALFFLGQRIQSRVACLLLALFNYVTAVWLTAGAYSSTHVMGNVLVEHALSWLLVPIYFHFHLVAPSPLIRRKWRYVLGPLYAIAAVLALLELFQVLPITAFGLAVLMGFLSSLGVLIFRFVFKPAPEDRRAVILMLVGISISFGPGVFLAIIPNLLQIALSIDLAAMVSWIAIPLLPFFYVYAIFKRYLGSFEPRFRRGLGLYSFILLYLAAIAAVFYLGSYWLGCSAEWGAFVVIMWTLFGVAAVPLYTLFRRLFSRLAYGVSYEPGDVLQTLAVRIQAIHGTEDWVRVLTDELDSPFLIRQSALYLLIGRDPELVYARGVEPDQGPETSRHIQRLLADAGRYRPFADDSDSSFAWVRLTLPLRVRGETVGAWLFGRRDPENYYSVEDVKLLATLAAQLAAVVENDRLYNQALREIAERKRIEEARRESEEMLRAILNATTESVMLVDDKMTILALNQTAAERFGRNVDDLAGLQIEDLTSGGLLSPELSESRAAVLNQVFRSGKPAQLEDERDGMVFDAHFYPVFDADGKVRRLAVFARDVTARRQAEQQVVRTERLAAMGQIATALVHEINNPLQAIRSNLEMLVDFDLGSDESKERLGIAVEEIQHLARITRRVLEFTQSAKESLRRVSAIHLMRRALALAGKQLELAHIQVKADFPDRPVYIFVAQNQIVQVLLNLINTVVEVVPGGGLLDIVVSINGGVAGFTLTGSGSGFVSMQLDHLFDPFYTTQADESTLGLWVSRGVIERHHGTITVQDLEDGSGVRFTVTLPVHSVPD